MTKETLKIGIALSGGGVRAAVFHLGVLGRLAVDHLLEKITFISTVSGGTLVTGLVYSIAGNTWPTSDFFLSTCLAQARYYLTQTNIERHLKLQLTTRPWYLFQRRAKLLSKSLQQCWEISGSLNDIPLEPRWVLNATVYESGKNWRFIPQLRMGDYVVNYVEKPSIPLTDAMAASAAYPGLIGPLVLRTKNFSWFQFEGQTQKPRQPCFTKIHLWDGGVYDNLGVEALFKIQERFRDEYHFLVVSDASNAIRIQKRSIFSWNRALRLLAIAMDPVRSLRARTLIAHFDTHKNSGVYLKIGNTGRKILKDAGIVEEFIDDQTKESLSSEAVDSAATFKTTLRKLKETEYDLLYRHGWEVANFTLQSRCPDLFGHKEWETSL